MNTKKHIQELLPVYLDKMCSLQEKKIVEQHLAECAACRKDLEDLKKTVALVSSLKEVEEPRYIWEEVEKKINKKSFFDFLLRPLPVVSTVAIVLLVLIVNKYTGDMNRTRQIETRAMAPVNKQGESAPRKKSLANKDTDKWEQKRDAIGVEEPRGTQALSDVSTVAKGKVMEKEENEPAPYLVELDVENMEDSFRQVQELADTYQAQKINRIDDVEVFLQIQEEQFNDFVRELSKLNSRAFKDRQQVTGVRPDLSAHRRFGGQLTGSKVIRVKFNQAR